jgi:hypothetical protein
LEFLKRKWASPQIFGNSAPSLQIGRKITFFFTGKKSIPLSEFVNNTRSGKFDSAERQKAGRKQNLILWEMVTLFKVSCADWPQSPKTGGAFPQISPTSALHLRPFNIYLLSPTIQK